MGSKKPPVPSTRLPEERFRDHLVAYLQHPMAWNFNTFVDGDTTPSVAGGNLFITANTSGTAITAFDDGAEGQVICVIINDTESSVTDAGTLKLAGNFGALASANAGSTITLCYSGTNWHEMTRSTN